MTPLPFAEAIAWARARQVVLPEAYYGTLQGLARAQAFTVTGLATLDQIQRVHASLTAVLESGETFATWQARALEDQSLLDLGPSQIETIFRNTIQQSYNRGRCEQQEAAIGSHPWWMYDAVNDSRTREDHAAMDGMTARHDDPIWDRWTPACGHRCRCRRVALTEDQGQAAAAADAGRWGGDPAKASARAAAQPDPGWGYNIYKDPNRGLAQALDGRRAACSAGEQLAVGATDAAIWCRHPALGAALDDMQRALAQGQDPAYLVREAMGRALYEDLAAGSRAAAQRFGLTEPQGVVVRAYTDRGLEAWPLMNTLARELPHTAHLSLAERDLYRAGLLVQMMDAALAALPARSGGLRRGQWLAGFGARREAFVRAHSRRGRIVQWNGYTSVMDGEPYDGDVKLRIWTDQARDLGAFSRAGEPELLLPRSIQMRIEQSLTESGVMLIETSEASAPGDIRREYQFHAA